MREEIDEFIAADGLVDQIDAVIDLIYFALGTLVEQGVEADPYFELVHTANMAKLSGDGSVSRRDDSKVLKPAGWHPPEHGMQAHLFREVTGLDMPTTTEQSYMQETADLAGRLLSVPLARVSQEEQTGVTRLDSRRPWPIGVRDDPLRYSAIDEPEFGIEIQKRRPPEGLTALTFKPDVLYGPGDDEQAHLGLVMDVAGEDVVLIDLHPHNAGLHWVRLTGLYTAFRSARGVLHRLTPN